jgi:hypothetical protein
MDNYSGLIPLNFMVHPANVERITRFVESVEPVKEGDSITLDEFFSRHFTGETRAGVCLQSARTTKELTEKELAELTGIPQRHISEMENGKRAIGKERAKVLAKVLHTDYRVFL